MYIQIDYSGNIELTGDDWIEIDGIRFEHREYMPDAERFLFSLPASSVLRDTSVVDPRMRETYPGIGIAIALGRYLNTLNKHEATRVNHEHQYIITNRPLLMTRGIIRFQRSDSSAIKITASPQYSDMIRSLDN
jgi:hypothetical protein